MTKKTWIEKPSKADALICAAFGAVTAILGLQAVNKPDLIMIQQKVSLGDVDAVVGGTEVCAGPPLVFVLSPPERRDCLEFKAAAVDVPMTVWRDGRTLVERWAAGKRNEATGKMQFTRPNGEHVTLWVMERRGLAGWMEAWRTG